MGEYTGIEYADSSSNPMMGCDGCELLSPAHKIFTCYAFTEVEKKKGLKGWPKDFMTPEVFPGRIDQALKWKDLTGKPRLDKEWLNGMPRIIFLNDMGDGFTKSLPHDYLLRESAKMAASPHIFLLLTKQARRMKEFFDALGYVPSNFWPGVSVTSAKTAKRIDALREIGDEHTIRWVSYEPALAEMNFEPYLDALKWIVVGGESDQKTEARPTELGWLRSVISMCRRAGVSVFVKQLGAKPYESDSADGPLHLRHAKGGDWTEWPDDLKVREMPAVEAARASLFV